MKKIMIISLVLAMAAGILLAQPSNRGAFDRKAPRRHEGGQCLEELGLSDAQSKKFDASRATFERQRNTLQADMDNLRMDVHDAMGAENFRHVKELNQQITAKQLELRNAHVDMIMDQMKELTKDQKVIMQKNMVMRLGERRDDFPSRDRRNRNNSRWGRRGQHMDRYWDDSQPCDDYDGVRKHRNRQ